MGSPTWNWTLFCGVVVAVVVGLVVRGRVAGAGGRRQKADGFSVMLFGDRAGSVK